MTAKNDITGDEIKTKGVVTQQFRDNFDRIFGKQKDVVEWPEDEERIDRIGQNGPTGEHYDELD